MVSSWRCRSTRASLTRRVPGTIGSPVIRDTSANSGSSGCFARSATSASFDDRPPKCRDPLSPLDLFFPSSSTRLPLLFAVRPRIHSS